jgi:hypothetical protein
MFFRRKWGARVGDPGETGDRGLRRFGLVFNPEKNLVLCSAVSNITVSYNRFRQEGVNFLETRAKGGILVLGTY